VGSLGKRIWSEADPGKNMRLYLKNYVKQKMPGVMVHVREYLPNIKPGVQNSELSKNINK
jgi:hypothetical protein